MDDIYDFEAPEYVSEEDEAYIRELFARFEDPELRQMNERDQAIALFLREHHDVEIFRAQSEALSYLQEGRKFH